MRKIKILAPISKAFENLKDPRSASGRRHPLKGMLVLALGAMLCGAKGPTAIVEWGKSRTREELKSLGFKRGISPSIATFCRLFLKLDSQAFEQGLRDYFAPSLDREQALAIDGKTLRRSHDGEIPAVHLLSALGQKTSVVFNECFVSKKTNEIKVIVPLLDELKINDKVITADALHTQKGFCDYVIDNGGDYLLTVKDNQKGLRESISDCFIGDFPPQEGELQGSE